MLSRAALSLGVILLPMSRLPLSAASQPAFRPTERRVKEGAGAKETAVVGKNRRQLFLDDYLIGEMKGLKRVLHQPTKHAANPIIAGAQPWETSADMPSVLFDQGQFRLWYRALDVKSTCRMAYAESKDGLTFDKPILNLIDFAGKKENNLVWGPMGDWANMVLKFPDEPDPAKRYQCLIWALPACGGYYGNIGLYSPDGLRWTMTDRPKAGKLDHAYNYCYDPLRKEYLSLIQFQTRPRTVGRMVSGDFVNWKERQEVLVPDKADPPGTEFYIPTITMIDDLYLCFLHIFHTNVKEALPRKFGTIAIQLATSRDGLHWKRAGERQVFLPLGPKGAFDHGMVFFVGPPVEHKGEVRFYYCGWDGDHGATKRKAAIGLASLRQDGYVSLEPQKEEGELTTRPFKLDGANVEVNADARRGALRVAVLDAAGKPVPGFDLADATPNTTDGLAQRLGWKGNKDLASLAGKVIQLKFHLRNARLFAFQVKP